MHSRSFNVFLACALGAGVGSLIALQLSAMLWWVGLLVGGLTGYLSYEWRAVISAVPRAYRAARGWEPSEEQVEFSKSSLAILAAVWSWPLLFLLSTVLVHQVAHITSPFAKVESFLIILMALATVMCLLFSVFFAPVALAMTFSEILPVIESPRAIWSSVSAPAVLFWNLPREVPGLFRFVRAFVWQVFVRIHSQERLICGVDAFLGAAVGYVAGSAIVGALVGGAMGVLNYELVTRRWLIPRGYVTLPVD